MVKNCLLVFTAIAAQALAACGNPGVGQADEKGDMAASDAVPKVTAGPGGGYDGTVTKPGSPYSISYRIIGTPVVGSPVTVGLRVSSTAAPRPVTLDYRINDASSMVFAESQLASVRMEPAANERFVTQQVTVVPQREGRFYLNVSASFETEEGTMETVTAIPIQVGRGGRELRENGEVELDDDGEAVRILTPE